MTRTPPTAAPAITPAPMVCGDAGGVLVGDEDGVALLLCTGAVLEAVEAGVVIDPVGIVTPNAPQ